MAIKNEKPPPATHWSRVDLRAIRNDVSHLVLRSHPALAPSIVSGHKETDMGKFRARQTTPPQPHDNVPRTVTDDEATEQLKAHLPGVKRIERAPTGQLTISWSKPPTEAERLFANELLPGAHHAD